MHHFLDAYGIECGMTSKVNSTFGLFILYLLFVPTLPGCQTQTSPDQPRITDVWTRPYQLEAGVTTAIYLTIHNPTPSVIQLTGATLPQSDAVEIHQSTLENSIMRMRPVSGVTLTPGSSISFEPGGHHLMVKGLQRNLAVGDSLVVAFQFDKGVAVQAVARVRWEREE